MEEWSHRRALGSIRAVTTGALEGRFPACWDALIGCQHALRHVGFTREVHLKGRAGRGDALVLHHPQKLKELLKIFRPTTYETHSLHVGGCINHILHTPQ